MGQVTAAQSPSAQGSPSPSAAPTFAPVEALRVPTDAELATDAALVVADQLPPGTIDLRDIAARADELVRLMPAADWSIDELAFALDYDPLAAFAFVRDSIGLDPYRGELRGPLGTLAARAGNDVDRALLLQALLDAMIVRTRLVVGELNTETVDTVLARAFEPPVQPLATAPLDQTEIGGLDAISRRARRDFARLRGALGDRLEAANGSANAAVSDELRTHVWVQMERGAEWVDLDPTLPDSEPGQALAAGVEILYAVPDDWRHTVSISVVAETLSGDTLLEQQVLEHRLDVSSDAGKDIYLTLQPEITSLGGSINEVLGSAVNWQPVLYTGPDPITGTPFAARPSRDIFDATESGPEVAAIYLDVTAVSPGARPRSARRVLFDRVPSEARSSAALDASQLLPLMEVEGVPLALQAVHQIQISNGGFREREHALWRRFGARFAALMYADPAAAASYGMPATLVPLSVANESLVLGSERLIDLGLDAEPDLRAYVADPRVFITSTTPAVAPNAMTLDVDLLIDSVRLLTREALGPSDAAVRQVWYGAVETAVETEHGLRRTAAFESEDSIRVGASFAMNMDLQAIDRSSLREFGDSIDTALARDLQAGMLAVVPGVVESARVWWAVDPSTGATQAVLSPGLGGIHHYVNPKPPGPPVNVPDPGGPAWSSDKMQRFADQMGREWERQQMRPPPRSGGFCGGNEYGTTLCPALIALGAVALLGIIIYLIV
jgi:hypothetical protein